MAVPMFPVGSPAIHAAGIFNPVNNSHSIVQIVPYPLSHRGGVSDYAKVLARSLADVNGLGTDFVTGLALSESTWRPPRAGAAILHYVNYGYHPRGIPFLASKKSQRDAAVARRSLNNYFSRTLRFERLASKRLLAATVAKTSRSTPGTILSRLCRQQQSSR